MRLIFGIRLLLAIGLVISLAPSQLNAQQRVRPTVVMLTLSPDSLSASRSTGGEAEATPVRYVLPNLRKPLLPFRYPERALRFRKEGWVKAEFTINEKGRVKKIEIVESFFADCEAEVKRVLRSALFEPVLDEAGQPMSARFAVGFDFKLLTK